MRPRDTRSVLLQHVVEMGGATVAALSAVVGISDATVRRHLERLEADGLLEIEALRRGPGRPSYLYRATDTGVSAVRDRSALLTERLLAEMIRLRVPPAALSNALANQVADAHRAEVHEGSLEERVGDVVDALRPEGILDSWEREADGIHLVNNACPYLGAATTNDLRVRG